MGWTKVLRVGSCRRSIMSDGPAMQIAMWIFRRIC